jgi:hypothetical protein
VVVEALGPGLEVGGGTRSKGVDLCERQFGDNTNFVAEAFRDVGEVARLFQAADCNSDRCQQARQAAERADLDYLLEEVPRAIAQTMEGVLHVARIVKAMKEFAHPGTDEKAPVDLNHAIGTVAHRISIPQWER